MVEMTHTLFSGGNVFDGREMRSGLGVLMAGRNITAVSTAESFAGFDGLTIDTTGMTLMPGMIDAHVHLAFDASETPDGKLSDDDSAGLEAAVASRALVSLQAGFVALRDCGGPGTTEFTIRDAIRRGDQAGPVIQACGQMIRKALNGFGDKVAYAATSDSDVPDAVRAVAATGADFINIMTTIDATACGQPDRPAYSADAVQRGVDAARALGLRTISNAQCAEDVVAAAAAGVASVEQGSRLNAAGIDAMIANDVVLVPILLARQNIDDARIARGGSPAAIDAAAELAAQTREAARRFVWAGGKLALGTDCGAPGSAHGTNGAELLLLAEAGLAPLDILRAATLNGADLMGLHDPGRIEQGARASLLLVAGDPTRNIRAVAETTHHHGVWHDGKRLPAR